MCKVAPGRTSSGTKGRTRDSGIYNVLGDNIGLSIGCAMGF